MSQVATHQSALSKQFVYLASELSTKFPQLDLRFNYQSESGLFRIMAAACSREIYEFPLGEGSTDDVLYEAIFLIKEVAQIFDA